MGGNCNITKAIDCLFLIVLQIQAGISSYKMPKTLLLVGFSITWIMSSLKMGPFNI